MSIVLTFFLACQDVPPGLPPTRYQPLPVGRLVQYGALSLYLLRANTKPEKLYFIDGRPTDIDLQSCAKHHWTSTTHIAISQNSANEIEQYLNGMTPASPPLTLERLSCPP